MNGSVRLVLSADGTRLFILVQVTEALLAPTCAFAPTHQVSPAAAAVADVHTVCDVALNPWVLGNGHGHRASTCCRRHHRCWLLGSHHHWRLCHWHRWLLHHHLHRWLLHHHWLHLLVANRIAHVLLLSEHLLLCHVSSIIRRLANRDSHRNVVLIPSLFHLCHFKLQSIILPNTL